MKKYIILPAALLMALAACNSGEDATANSAENTPVSFTASITGQQTSRAYDQTWENGDKIGISGKSGDVAYTNEAYETENGSGSFTIVKGSSEIYYQTTDPVTFTAYYPYTDLADGVTAITADTWGQSAQKNFDFLWAQAEGSKASKNVAFNFTHRMAKLALTIEAGTGVSPDEVKAAKLMLSGYYHMGSFDTTTGEAKADTETTAELWQFANNDEDIAYNAPFTPGDADGSVTYSLIMFPQSFEATSMTFEAELAQTLSVKLDFTAANENAKDAAPKNELVAGRQYNLSIVLNKKDATVTGCTISKWEEAAGGSFSAE